MPFTSVTGLRAGLVVAALTLVPVFAAQESPLLGATREQVLARYGEPRSVMASSGREILFFARERIVLRDGVVIEVEPLPAEPPPRRAAPPAASPTQTSPSADAAAATSGAENASGNAPSSGAAQPSSSTGAATTPAPAAPETAAPRPAEPAAPREPEIAIKLVRPPSGTYTRPAPKQAAPNEARTPDSKPAPATAPVIPTVTAPVAPAVDQPATPTPAPTPTVQPTESTDAPRLTEAERAAPAPTQATAEPPPAVPPPAATEPPDVVPAATLAAVPTTPERTARTTPFIIGAIVVVLGFLFWRRRQRQLALAATAVSRELSSDGPAVAAPIVQFTPAHLAKLSWKHFEELVAAYYGKTGVVAERTKAGPNSPVHINISWKGESRPFALVHCIAHPVGAVGVKPLQDLVTVLAKEDIRRGYVVTSGNFAPEARDYAEEKHLTLLAGDAFLEKLNALPNSARAEVMHEVMQGDPSTPVCPKCEARMVRTPGDPSVYRCPTHADVTLPAR